MLTLFVLSATTLFFNGNIRTGELNDATQRSQWMTVNDGKVVDYGPGDPPASESTNKVDLKGRHVLPGLVDAHAHIANMGDELSQVDLRKAANAEEATARVASHAAKDPNLPAILGSGWDQSDWHGKEFPSRELLDRVTTKKPIVLYRIDGHAAWVNTYALKKLGVWKKRPDPQGGRVLRDPKGQPTGVLVDAAMNGLRKILPKPTPAQIEHSIELAVKSATKLGITGIHDANASLAEIEAIERLLESGRVRFRFYEFVSADDRKKAFKKGSRAGTHDNQLSVRAVKLFVDGAMGSRGAAFEEPYSDDPSTKGLLQMTPGELEKTIREIDRAGFQVAIHAIGTKGNRVVLDAIEKVWGNKTRAKRPRLEHAQVMHKSDIERAARLGVIASMQPVHCTSDMKWVVDRVGKERARYSYAWKSFLTAGATLAFGSDAPVELINPWHGLYAAITRQDAKGSPEGGFFPEERLSLVEAYRAFTDGAAYASFQEGRAGRLDKGRLADFIVVGKDPFAVSVNELREMEVEETYVGGERVWTRETGGGA